MELTPTRYYKIPATPLQSIDPSSIWYKFLSSIDRFTSPRAISNKELVDRQLDYYDAVLIGSFYSRRIEFTDYEKYVEFILRWS